MESPLFLIITPSIFVNSVTEEDKFFPAMFYTSEMDWLLAPKAARQSQGLRCDAEGCARLQLSPEDPI